MAIATQDDIVAGVQAPLFYFKTGNSTKGIGVPTAIGLRATGIPTSFTFGTPGLAGTNIDGTTNTSGGTFPFTNPVSGNVYLSKFTAMGSTNIIAVKLVDFLWYNSGITITTSTAQTINSGTLPARDANGTTNGVGISAWLYCQAISSNQSSSVTLSYTNSSGVSGRTATLQQPWYSTMVSGSYLPFTLAGGDVGIQSVQSITLGANIGGGTVNLLLVREIITMPLIQVNGGQIFNWAQTGLPILYNGSALTLAINTTTNSYGVLTGEIGYTRG